LDVVPAKRFETMITALMFVTVAVAVVIGMASPASADVDFYVAPQLGISGGIVDTDGKVSGTAGTLVLKGSDSDSTALLGLAVGLEMPMNEIVPREWLADARLPDWPVRFELEAVGLRDFDFKTNAPGGGDYFTEIKATTTMANTWLDFPLITAWKPFQYVFGLGPQPRLRRWLEPGSLYLGGGIGFAALEINGTDNVFRGKDDIIDFAWNVGAGVNYALTDRVTISAGYRYVGLGPNAGSQDVDLVGPISGTNDSLDYDLQVHELRVAIRVRVFSFRGAWR
jgi:opacity protein-like surface antigen